MASCPACGAENRDGARFCDACGAELAGAAPPREVRKVVTVLFADVAGFTAAGEQLDPEALRRLQSRYFDEARAAVERHGASVEKFIGDAVMAVFGVPHVHEDDALRAVRAAVELREAVAPLEVRIGVNTGEVVAGRGDALVTGDAVNVAARLEQSAEPGAILIGEPTYRLVRDAVRAEPVDAVDAKGKAMPVSAYRVQEVVIGGSPARSLGSPLVGREQQRRLLGDALERAARERSCHLFTLLGTAGVGKSRLVGEFLADVGRSATILRGRCLPYGDGITFWALTEMFREAGAEEALDRALVAGSREETFWAVRKAFEGFAADRPLVAVFDDIHWAEATLLDLVEHIADWSRDAPILLLCVARPELLDVRSGWAGGKLNATSLLLEPLTGRECELLLDNLLGRSGLEAQVRARVVEAAEGNPLFVEELLEMLIDDALLERSNGGWVAVADLSSISVPPTIQALLAARLDRLEPDERGVIERAAVEGKVFHRGAVAELSPSDRRRDVPTCLMALVRKELIRPDRSSFEGDDGFRFRHLLIRDAAYAGLPKEGRAELHERFAAWLEERAGEDATEYEEILAYHLEQAYLYRHELGTADEGEALSRRAAELLVTSGRRALQAGDFGAARSLLSRAVDLRPREDAIRVGALPDLALALFEAGELDRASEVADEAIRLGDEQARAYGGLVALRGDLQQQRSMDEVGHEAERLRTEFERFGDQGGAARALELVGLTLIWRGQAQAGIEVCRRAQELARRADDPALAVTLGRWINVAMTFGPTRPEEAFPELEQAIAAGGLRQEAEAANAYAAFKAMVGSFDEARGWLARTIAVREELGFALDALSVSSHVGGFIELLEGDLQAAEARHRAALEGLERMGETGYLSTTAAMLADVLNGQGRYEEAVELTDVSERVAAHDDVSSQIEFRSARGTALARLGEIEAAEAIAREAVAIGETIDHLNHRGNAYLALAEVLQVAGREEEATEAITEAIRVFELKGNVVQARRARELLAGGDGHG